MPADRHVVVGPRSGDGSTAGRPAGREPAWLDPDDASGSAWEDLSSAGSGAWDDDRAGAAEPAWADDVAGTGGAWESAASAGPGVWDDDAPAPASAWLDGVGDGVAGAAQAERSSVRAARSPSRTRGRGAARPEDPEDLPNGEPVRERWGRAAAVGAPGTTGSATGGSGTGGSATGGSARSGSETGRSGTTGSKAGRSGTTGSGSTATAGSGEVAAVAARLAEIVARRGPGGGGSVRDAVTGADGGDRVPADGVVPADGPVPADAFVPADELEPAAARRSGGRSGAGRGSRARGGRRAPATEPPGSGAAGADAEPDPESVARAIALRQLAAAPRSRAQLAEAMARRDVPEDVAESVLDRFTEVGLVDDAAYAEMLVRSRHAERKLSRRALAQELRRKGVDDETARDALDQVDDEDEEQAARALARKKLAATRGLDREVRLRRAYGALGRKGYGGSLVSRVVREELAAEGAPDEGDWTPAPAD